MASPPSGTRATPLVADRQEGFSQAIQIPPIRRHASSGYHYYPEILEPYGVSNEDWSLFITQFVNANMLTGTQLTIIGALSAICQAAFVFGLGPPGLPAGAIASAVFMSGPVYFAVKGHRLRQNVRNNNIPKWLTAWNEEYFNPKGLMVGFNLPGRKVYHAAVAPRPRKYSMVVGKYKKPKKSRSAAKRARIIIVKLHDPVANVGVVPKIDPVKISALWKCLYHRRSSRGLTQKLWAKVQAQAQAVEDMKQKRLQESMDHGGVLPQSKPQKEWKQLWEAQAAFRVLEKAPRARLWRRVLRRKKMSGQSQPAAVSLDGTNTRSVSNQKKKMDAKKAAKAPMLGSSRICDASRHVL